MFRAPVRAPVISMNMFRATADVGTFELLIVSVVSTPSVMACVW